MSFFPQRAGRNFPDYSGVHASIRKALRNRQTNRIHSVHDLALIIMNECSAIFFDRTKPPDERPMVLDIFSNALSDVVSEHDTLWPPHRFYYYMIIFCSSFSNLRLHEAVIHFEEPICLYRKSCANRPVVRFEATYS
jgi:hypothetical protein